LGLVGCSSDDAMVDISGNHYPQVLSWACTPESGEAPLEATCLWQLRDADGDAVSCQVDVGNDGQIDATIQSCPLESGTMLTLKAVGQNLVRLHVADTHGLQDTRDAVVEVTGPPDAAPN